MLLRIAPGAGLSRMAALLATAFLPALQVPGAWAFGFTDVSSASGLDVQNGNVNGWSTEAQKGIGGVGCGDYDGDGWSDLYIVSGDAGTNYLMRNNGDGTFSNVSVAAGVALTGQRSCGPTFSDWNGDGFLDLIVGGIEISPPTLFRNNGDGTFSDITASTGVVLNRNTWSSTFGDYDNDDDLDLLMTHWNRTGAPLNGHLWRNNGDGTFNDVGVAAGIVGFPNAADGNDYSLSGNFADIDNDGWKDILWAVDFGEARIFHNNTDGTFSDVTDLAVITDENAMGTGVADYDHDGDLDYFVSNIYDPSINKTGNRFYRNNGDGTFTDATSFTGTRDGLWGWAASFQDFDNDGWQDIFHVNGFISGTFQFDHSRLFMADGDGTFTESAATFGAADSSQGRGIACFDYDRDGDIDIFIQNNGFRAVMLRNDGGNANNWLDVKLTSTGTNTEQIGARIYATVGTDTQMWEMRSANNYVSQDPAEAHFGLAAAAAVDLLRIEWTNGQVTSMTNVPANQRLVLAAPAGAVDAPVVGPASRERTIAGLSAAPNPFRTGTRIAFQLRRESRTRVRIYDASGRALRTFDAGRLPAGPRTIDWDGRDAGGKATASGVYYYEVRTRDDLASGKVVHLR